MPLLDLAVVGIVGLTIGGIFGTVISKIDTNKNSTSNKPKFDHYPIDIESLAKSIENGNFSFEEAKGDRLRIKHIYNPEKFSLTILCDGWHFTDDPTRNDKYPHINNNCFFKVEGKASYFKISSEAAELLLDAKNKCLKNKVSDVLGFKKDIQLEDELTKGVNEAVKQLNGKS